MSGNRTPAVAGRAVGVVRYRSHVHGPGSADGDIAGVAVQGGQDDGRLRAGLGEQSPKLGDEFLVATITAVRSLQLADDLQSPVPIQGVGAETGARYDSSRRRWRHLDAGGCRLWLEADIRGLDCRRCGRVVTEEVPWARPGAWHCRDFEDVVAWLAQRADKTTIATLLRCNWKAVDNIIRRVVADQLDTARLQGLDRIGVDEISYRRGHSYLTVVADHDSGRVVWVAKGKRGQALQDFYDAMGPQQRERIEAVSMDLSTIYTAVTQDALPAATICYDPFHVIQLANRALDLVLSASPNGADGRITGAQWRAARVALRSGVEKLDRGQKELVNTFRRTRRRVFQSLGTQRRPPLPLPRRPPPRPPLPQSLDHRRPTQPHPRLPQPRQNHPHQLRRHLRRRRARTLQQPPRRRADGVERIWLPGEIEHARQVQRPSESSPVRTPIVDELRARRPEVGAEPLDMC
jgi:hypothetical protein